MCLIHPPIKTIVSDSRKRMDFGKERVNPVLSIMTQPQYVEGKIANEFWSSSGVKHLPLGSDRNVVLQMDG